MFMFNTYLQSFADTYPLINAELFGNSIADWTVAAAVFILTYAVLKFFKFYLLRRLKKLAGKTTNEFDDVIIGGLDAIHWPFNLFISLYVAQLFLHLPESIERVMYYILIITVTYYIMRVIQATVDVLLERVLQTKAGADKKSEEGTKLFATVIKLGLWALAALLVLSNLGYNVTSLIAGLGVSGIIIAFAVQNILADLFSSLSIYFDKPFAPGDFVVISGNGSMGTVKHIGLRTTRIQSLGGEELIVPNSEITKATIQNYGRMQKRRVVFSFGIARGTEKKKLEKIPAIVQRAIESIDDTAFDRAHFNAYGDFSLNYEVVYYVKSANYNTYMDIQQAINLAIYEAFGKEGIEFAFPTQTVRLEK